MTTAKTLRRLGLAAAVAAPALAGCTDWAGYDIDVAAGKVPQLATMRQSVIPDPYAMVRLPAEGSVPIEHPLGDVPPPYSSLQLDSVAPTLRNPYAGTPEPAVLERGRQQYLTHCGVCHGPAGAGDGPVVRPAQGRDGQSYTRFPYAPPLVSGGALTRSEGYVYAVIDVGRGLMPPYGERIPHADRWAIVAYVRELQRQAGATPVPAAAPGQTGGTSPAQAVPGAVPAAPGSAPSPAPAAPAAPPAQGADTTPAQR